MEIFNVDFYILQIYRRIYPEKYQPHTCHNNTVSIVYQYLYANIPRVLPY